MAEQMYAQAGAEAQQGGAGDESAASGGADKDSVVDAEFEEVDDKKKD
jgi:molecular chaperone DnaK